jgi:hypothetical protein
MNDREALKLMDTIKSINIEGEQTQVSSDITTDRSLYKATSIKPIVSEMGSAYTAQNNITVESIPGSHEVSDIHEVDYSYINTLKKPFYIKSFQVTPANTVGQNVFTLNLPSDYFAANHVLQNIGNTFKSFRGDFHLLISIQGTPLALGALAAIVTYGSYTGSYVSQASTLQNAYYKHHAILDYSDNSNTTDLVIPFRYMRNAVDPFATVHSVRFTPIVALAGQTAITVTISAFVENPVFRFLRPVIAPTLRETQGLISVTNINNTMRDVIDSTLPTNLTGDTIDINPSMMDAIPIPTNPNPFLVKYNSMNNANNPFPIERPLLNSGSQRISDRHTFGTTMDEMSIKSITQKEHFHTSFNISTATAVNSTIFASYVTPCMFWRANAAQPVTPLDSLTSEFKYWRGGLKFKLRFYMNRFQSCKLYAAMFYKDTEPSVLVDFSTSHGVVLDIGGDQREVEVEIPYNAETAWLYCPKRPGEDLTVLTTQNVSLGKFALYAITPLISPEGSPTNIICHVTLSASDDFEYATYASSSGATQSIMLSKESTRTPNDITDVITSVKIPMKKYTKRANHRSTAPVKDYDMIAGIINPMQTWNDYDAEGPWTTGKVLLSKPFYKRVPLANLFNAIRGGQTVRIETEIARTQKEIMSNYHSWVPFCVWVNGPQVNTTAAVYGPLLSEALSQYYLEEWNSSVAPSTPYHIQPINPTVFTEGTKAIFEVDCSFLRIAKYALTSPSGTQQSHGLLMWGWYNPIKDESDRTGEIQVYSQVFQKLSDDARHGLAEVTGLSMVPKPYWDAALQPVIT